MIRPMCLANMVVVMMMLACAAIAGDIAGDLRTAFGTNGADSITAALDAARESGIPVVALENKIREGIAKGRTCREILDAMSIRAACLAQMEKDNAGVLPEQYVKQLYRLEKERYGIQVKERLGHRDQQPLPQTMPEKPQRSEDATVRKNAPSPATGVEPQAGMELQRDQDSGMKAKPEPTERTQDENERRIEALMEKSEQKAEKNERNMEKKMEKQERKQRQGG